MPRKLREAPAWRIARLERAILGFRWDNTTWRRNFLLTLFVVVYRYWLGQCYNRPVFKHLLHCYSWLGPVLHVCVLHFRASLVSMRKWMEHAKLCGVYQFCRRRKHCQQFLRKCKYGQHHSYTNGDGEHVKHFNSTDGNCDYGKGVCERGVLGVSVKS